MTDPSQYFKGRTVQEQMNEVIGYVDVRSAEVATTAIAADVAQVHQDMLDADADATAAAASAAAAAGTLANAVKKTGEASQSIAGDIAVAGDVSVGGDLAVTGTATVQTPVNNTDAATKKYVDDQDALKISITDINSYAVGLTGNQGPILGVKDFEFSPKHSYNGCLGSGSTWHKIWVSETSVGTVYRSTIVTVVSRDTGNYAKFLIRRRTASQNAVRTLINTFTAGAIMFTRDNDGEMIMWVNDYRLSAWIEGEFVGNAIEEYDTSSIVNDNTDYPQPVAADYVWSVVI